MSKQLWFTDSLTTKDSVLNVDKDYVVVVTNQGSNRQDTQYLLSIAALFGDGTGLFVPNSAKGVANGVATLDGSGLIPLSQLPPGAFGINDLITSSGATWSSSKITNELGLKASVTHSVTHVIGGSDIIDADNLEISLIPANYVRVINANGQFLQSLSAHLQGIDNALATVAKVEFREVRTITPLEISSKQLLLNNAVTQPTRVEVFPYGGIKQFPGIDFNASGTLLTWNSMGLDGLLEIGDTIEILYR